MTHSLRKYWENPRRSNIPPTSPPPSMGEGWGGGDLEVHTKRLDTLLAKKYFSAQRVFF